MSITARLNARQRGAGQPIDLSAWVLFGTPADQAHVHAMNVGVTTTSTPPATISDLSHKDVLDTGLIEPFWDTSSEQFAESSRGSTTFRTTDRYQATKHLVLDSNYSAGKYLWFFGYLPPSSGSTAIDWCSNGYLIQ